MAKKRAPQDATLRNIRASRTREATLGSRIAALEYRVVLLEEWIVGYLATQHPRLAWTSKKKT